MNIPKKIGMLVGRRGRYITGNEAYLIYKARHSWLYIVITLVSCCCCCCCCYCYFVLISLFNQYYYKGVPVQLLQIHRGTCSMTMIPPGPTDHFKTLMLAANMSFIMVQRLVRS